MTNPDDNKLLSDLADPRVLEQQPGELVKRLLRGLDHARRDDHPLVPIPTRLAAGRHALSATPGTLSDQLIRDLRELKTINEQDLYLALEAWPLDQRRQSSEAVGAMFGMASKTVRNRLSYVADQLGRMYAREPLTVAAPADPSLARRQFIVATGLDRLETPTLHVLGRDRSAYVAAWVRRELLDEYLPHPRGGADKRKWHTVAREWTAAVRAFVDRDEAVGGFEPMLGAKRLFVGPQWWPADSPQLAAIREQLYHWPPPVVDSPNALAVRSLAIRGYTAASKMLANVAWRDIERIARDPGYMEGWWRVPEWEMLAGRWAEGFATSELHRSWMSTAELHEARAWLHRMKHALRTYEDTYLDWWKVRDKIAGRIRQLNAMVVLTEWHAVRGGHDLTAPLIELLYPWRLGREDDVPWASVLEVALEGGDVETAERARQSIARLANDPRYTEWRFFGP